MSEQHHGSGHEHKEVQNSHEVKSDAVQQKHERELTHAETQHGNKEQLEAIRSVIDKQAPVENEAVHHGETAHSNHHPVLINKHIKEMSFSRSMTRARKKLSVPSRAFSKVIHVDAIDKSSEFIGKTVARPSSMLSGAFIAFIGTSALLWATRYYGYEYNYLLFILLFVGGAIIGVAGEGLWRMTHKQK